MTRIALIDYGIGNLRSVEKALQAAGADTLLTSTVEGILAADKIVLPGVGAFGNGMEGLRARGLVDVLRQTVHGGKPLLGICLGMQLLFQTGEEMGEYTGLGLLAGRVKRFPNYGLKVPQTGWNQLLFPPPASRPAPLLEGLEPGCYAYFNHSFYCEPVIAEEILALTEYGLPYASIVGRERLYGMQFHPEKSQEVGMQLLRNFVERG